jgi:hypothetical protein
MMLPKCCCDLADAKYRNLIKCSDDSASVWWVLDANVSDPDAIVIKDQICYYFGPPTSPPLPGGAVVISGLSTNNYIDCADCRIDHPEDPPPPHVWPCDAFVHPGVGGFTWPDIRIVPFGVSLCGCWVVNPGPGGEESYTITDVGLNGARIHTTRALTAPPVGSTYDAGALYEPRSGHTTGPNLIHSRQHLGSATCAETGFPPDPHDDDVTEMTGGVGLSCDDDGSGWKWAWSIDFEISDAISQILTANSSGNWNGVGGIIATVNNPVAQDPDCDGSTPAPGVGGSHSGGGGAVRIIATLPGF